MLKKTAVVLLVVAVSIIGYWLASPLFIDRKVSETLEDIQPTPTPTPVETSPDIVSTGSFSGLAGHNAQGTAKLIKNGGQYYIRFEDDFKVTNGPDLFVYFGKDGNYVASAQIAALKGNIGAQNYEVPAGIRAEDYDEVWVWCRAFSVPFGRAVFR